MNNLRRFRSGNKFNTLLSTSTNATTRLTPNQMKIYAIIFELTTHDPSDSISIVIGLSPEHPNASMARDHCLRIAGRIVIAFGHFLQVPAEKQTLARFLNFCPALVGKSIVIEIPLVLCFAIGKGS